jgi:hypothetical protein
MNKNIKLVNITEGALHTYRNFISNNKYDSEETARKKLTRNILTG